MRHSDLMHLNRQYGLLLPGELERLVEQRQRTGLLENLRSFASRLTPAPPKPSKGDSGPQFFRSLSR